ncbi:hypothetical protein SAMN06265218_106243 [Fodinibius sediminis]|uniref:Uncharacterized protein n=1 Tax=Fodinibius sediminis TaxID=1214077 RepID=A0A521CN13_9BACT|nr:hypothetical protein SAMN06265218_106243 [Fodinibius sediminis]
MIKLRVLLFVDTDEFPAVKKESGRHSKMRRYEYINQLLSAWNMFRIVPVKVSKASSFVR